MDNSTYEKLIEDFEELKNNIDSKQAKKLNLELLSRIIKRLASFFEECEACRDYLVEVGEKITQMSNVEGQLTNDDFKSYKALITKITDHLEKNHKLLSEGYHLSIYMSIGMSFGLIFGMLLFDNIALGLPLGMSLGMAIGAGIDADNKKKGKTI